MLPDSLGWWVEGWVRGTGYVGGGVLSPHLASGDPRSRDLGALGNKADYVMESVPTTATP